MSNINLPNNDNDPTGSAGLIEMPQSPIEATPWIGLAQFHSNETLAMLQRYDHIEKLIQQGHHSETEGAFCEHLLRTFLRETVPGRFSVDTGFILGNPIHVPWRSGNSPKFDWKEMAASPQIDILIHDTVNYAPVLRAGDFVIVLPESVEAIITVKKTLTSGQLQSALQNLAAAKYFMSYWILSRRDRPFTAAFAFEAEKDLIPKEHHISETYYNRFSEICDPFSPACGIPDLVIVARHLCLGRIEQNDYTQPLLVSWSPVEYGGVNYSGQILLFHLMKRLQLPEIQTLIRRFQWPEELPLGGQFSFDNPTKPRTPLPDFR